MSAQLETILTTMDSKVNEMLKLWNLPGVSVTLVQNGETIFSRRFPSYMLCCLAALIAVSFIQMFSLLFFEKVSPMPLVMTAAMQIVTSMVFAVIMYPAVKKLSHSRQNTYLMRRNVWIPNSVTVRLLESMYCTVAIARWLVMYNI